MGKGTPEQSNLGALSPIWHRYLDHDGPYTSIESAEVYPEVLKSWEEWQTWATKTIAMLEEKSQIVAMAERNSPILAPPLDKPTCLLPEVMEKTINFTWPPGKEEYPIEIRAVPTIGVQEEFLLQIEVPTEGKGSRKRGLEELALSFDLDLRNLQGVIIKHLPWGQFKLWDTRMAFGPYNSIEPGSLFFEQRVRLDTYSSTPSRFKNEPQRMQEAALQMMRVEINTESLKGTCEFTTTDVFESGDEVSIHGLNIDFSEEELRRVPIRILRLEPALAFKEDRFTFWPTVDTQFGEELG